MDRPFTCVIGSLFLPVTPMTRATDDQCLRVQSQSADTPRRTQWAAPPSWVLDNDMTTTEMNHPGPREAVNTTTHSGFGFCFVWEKKREEGMRVINIPVRKLMA